MRRARLILDDGSCFEGWSFGYEGDTAGEVVFNTAMTGYPESLTDPSYAGQILVMTYPLVGNYGAHPDWGRHSGTVASLGAMESDHIHVKALVVADYSEHYAHWNAGESLAEWLQREHIPALTGIDTRRLTKKLREHGVMMGKIETHPQALPVKEGSGHTENYGEVNWVEQVSCKEVITYKPDMKAAANSPLSTLNSKLKTVLLVDCGVKNNIIRCLLKRGVEVIRVPWDYDFNQLDFDGLFLGNGPGDPEQCEVTVRHIRTFLETESSKQPNGETDNSSHIRPCMGICLGNQLLARAAGASTYKLKYGHRSHNQPVMMVHTHRCFITSQNHGYAVDDKTLPHDWEPLFVNMNDGSNEGIRHKTYPWFSAQFHPEACGGPVDTEFLFDEFVALLETERAPRPLDLSRGARCEVRGARIGSIADVSCLESSRGKTDLVPRTSYLVPRLSILAPRTSKVLLLGSGALKIGQAGEFDYSGSQALKALKEEGIKTVLINPNVATVQTSEGVADKVYFQPVTPDFVERVIDKERPDGILLSFGGQTALNCGVELYHRGVFEKYGVTVLGTPIQAIIDTEDRERFVQRLDEIGVKTIPSIACNDIDSVLHAAAELGYPVILRAAYALGGLGSGFCDDEQQLRAQAEEAFSFSPQVLVEKSLRGWKEIEYEVVRDAYDNCITVCNMENFDPLGIHTGESIVVAPSQTLTNAEYHKLRDIAIRIIRHIGIVGECNVQYALDPLSEDYSVIEVNARLSRSSALASKATGYPLAFVAAKLSLGYGLFDLKNSVTKTTSAFFEPALDYVVCKIPRWDLSKFHGVSHRLGSSMKSVGEVMAIGRTFEEAFQKGLRMIGQGMHGFVGNHELHFPDIKDVLTHATDSRVFALSKAIEMGFSIGQLHTMTMIDRWFLYKLQHIIVLYHQLCDYSYLSELIDTMDSTELMELLEEPSFVHLLYQAKIYGFSDFQIARAIGLGSEHDMEQAGLIVRKWRKELGIMPHVNQIDTLAAEYPAQTNYLYLSYL